MTHFQIVPLLASCGCSHCFCSSCYCWLFCCSAAGNTVPVAKLSARYTHTHNHTHKWQLLLSCLPWSKFRLVLSQSCLALLPCCRRGETFVILHMTVLLWKLYRPRWGHIEVFLCCIACRSNGWLQGKWIFVTSVSANLRPSGHANGANRPTQRNWCGSLEGHWQRTPRTQSSPGSDKTEP